METDCAWREPVSAKLFLSLPPCPSLVHNGFLKSPGLQYTERLDFWESPAKARVKRLSPLLLHDIFVFHVILWCIGVPKSREILMFVCLQKDAKQCCDATKVGCAHCAGRRQSASTMSSSKLCGVTALFGVFLETNKHQNLMRLSNQVTHTSNKHHTNKRQYLTAL